MMSYVMALLLLQLFKAHMDYVERTKVPATYDKPADSSVGADATPRRFDLTYTVRII